MCFFLISGWRLCYEKLYLFFERCPGELFTSRDRFSDLINYGVFWHLIMGTKWHYCNFPVQLMAPNGSPILYNGKDPEPFLSVSTFW